MTVDKLVPLVLLILIVVWAPYFFVKSIMGYTDWPKARIGSVLILLGVSAWVPYLALKTFGEFSGAVFPFLIVHLAGVVTGAFLKGREWTKRVMEMTGRGGEPDGAGNG